MLRRTALALAAALTLALPWAAAQDVRLPGASLTVDGEATTLRYGSVEATYVDGIGWLNGWPAPPASLRGGDVVVAEELLAWLGVDLPRLTSVRFGGDGALRVVLDFAESPPADLSLLEREGVTGPGEVLELLLPRTLLPAELPTSDGALDLAWEQRPDGTLLRLAPGASRYRVTALGDPPRLVIDLIATAPPVFTPEDIEPVSGVRYRRFAFANGFGGSVVHAVELTPGSGDLRVVGESGVPRRLSELASGGLVAINAGYFDPDTFAAIGLLTIDRGLLSPPSRNRAALAVGPEGVAIARVSARVELVAAGRSIHVADIADGWRLATTGGAVVGTPSDGVVSLARGAVVANRIGPEVVPQGGSAIVYDPALRAVAAVDAGTPAELRVGFAPSGFRGASYAVEAGPLLVERGRPAFDPEREGFARGQRILDDVTQQAAIGVRADGTVLLVVAEAMNAEGMVPLLLALGADRAMRLDSGSSAGLLVDGELVNRAFERRLVTALVWIPSEAE